MELPQAQKWVQNELRQSIDFWIQNGLDKEYGGILTCLDRKGQVYATDKSVWMQGRAAWTFSRLCNTYGYQEEWARAAQSCLDFLEQHCINHEAQGRLYFTVTREGKPLRQRRYYFSESFYTIGNAEYYGVKGDQTYLERARRGFDLYYKLYKGMMDPTGLGPKTIPSTRTGRSLANSMILINICHVMLLYDKDVERQVLYEGIVSECIECILCYHFKPELGCLLETVGPQGEFQEETTAGRVVNPGHDMECAWFILEAAKRTGNAVWKGKAEDIFRMALNMGYDQTYGGLLYFVDALGYPPEAYEHDMKLWWPHNELLICSLMLYQETGKTDYLDIFSETLDYCKKYFADELYGEWFGYLRRDGQPTEPPCKGSTFKGPFHVQRCLIMLDKMLDVLV